MRLMTTIWLLILVSPAVGQNIGLEQIKQKYGEWGSRPAIIIEKSTMDVNRGSLRDRGYYSPGSFRPVKPESHKEKAPPRSSGKGPYGLLPASQGRTYTPRP